MRCHPLRQNAICCYNRCKGTKKKVVKRKKIKKKVLIPQSRGNVTSVGAFQRKKAALKTKIQDILNGRSRFVIRKVPAVGSTGGRDLSSGGQSTSDGQQKEKVDSPPSVSRSNEEVKTDRCWLLIIL